MSQQSVAAEGGRSADHHLHEEGAPLSVSSHLSSVDSSMGSRGWAGSDGVGARVPSVASATEGEAPEVPIPWSAGVDAAGAGRGAAPPSSLPPLPTGEPVAIQSTSGVVSRDLVSAMGLNRHHHPGQSGGSSEALEMSSPLPLSETVAAPERATLIKGMTVPPQSRQWASELGERMMLMVGKKIHSAEIRLNPPNLGVLEVKLSVNGDQVQLLFQSGSASVRDAVESSIPRLREMLEQSGATVVEVNVGKRGQRGAAHPEHEGGGMPFESWAGMEEDMGGEPVAVSSLAVDRMGLVDYYV